MSEEREEEGLQMSFLEHLDELRRRLIYSVTAIFLAFGICFTFADRIYRFLEIPVLEQLAKLRLARLAEGITPNIDQLKEGTEFQYTFATDQKVQNVKIPAGTTIPAKVVRAPDGKLMAVTAQPWVINKTLLPAETPLSAVFNEGELPLGLSENDQLVLTKVTGAFTLYMQVALYAGIALALPFLLYQIWAFVAPGLYQHEKRFVLPVILMGSIFFVLGAAFGYKIAFPAAANYLLGLQVAGNFRPMITADDYFDLIIIIMLGLGIVFQIPTIAFLLGRLGLITPRVLWKAWRYAVMVIVVLAAVLTPTADAFNMILFAAPMLFLYFFSIGIVWLFGKPRRSESELRELVHSK